jgi:hypothetical protein
VMLMDEEDSGPSPGAKGDGPSLGVARPNASPESAAAAVGDAGGCDGGGRHCGSGQGVGAPAVSGSEVGGGAMAGVGPVPSGSSWLVRDLGKSVYKLREDLMVLHLEPEACPPATWAASLAGWAAYLAAPYPDAPAAAATTCSAAALLRWPPSLPPLLPPPQLPPPLMFRRRNNTARVPCLQCHSPPFQQLRRYRCQSDEICHVSTLQLLDCSVLWT